MTDLQKEFKKYVKEEFDCDVVEVPREEADTFEKLFGTNFIQLNEQESQEVATHKGTS